MGTQSMAKRGRPPKLSAEPQAVLVEIVESDPTATMSEIQQELARPPARPPDPAEAPPADRPRSARGSGSSGPRGSAGRPD